MNDIFHFEGLEVRTVVQDDEILFVAADVCRALEIKDASMAVRSLSDDEKGTSLICTSSGNQQMLCVTEAGLYRMIFRSRKKSAERFRCWVFHEVLPQIRKTGGYQMKSSQLLARQSVVEFLQEKFPEAVLPSNFLFLFGKQVRKMAHPMGVRGVFLEDFVLGEAMAWPVPFLNMLLERMASVHRPVRVLPSTVTASSSTTAEEVK